MYLHILSFKKLMVGCHAIYIYYMLYIIIYIYMYVCMYVCMYEVKDYNMEVKT